MIRQTTDVMKVIGGNTEVKISLGEAGQVDLNAHILVTVPGYLKNKLSARKVELDLTELKSVIYDEADELFTQHTNHDCFKVLKKHLEKIKVSPQHCLYSATYTNTVIETAKTFDGDFSAFTIPTASLKLKGVKNFKLLMKDPEKIEFIAQLHTNLEKAMTMVFVNRKVDATTLQAKLLTKDIKAKILIGGLENKERD